MSEDSRREAIDLWKTPSLLRRYVEGVRGGLPCAVEQIDVMLRVIEATGKALSSFLDLGCGSGILAGAILSRYPEARGTLVDFSDAMLEEARAQLSEHVSKLSFINADLRKEEWLRSVEARGPFEAVVSGYAIHHLTDRRKRELYREIFDLLGPGGLFVNLDHVSSSTPWVAGISDRLHVDSLYAFHASKGSPKSREQIAEEYARRPDQEANILAPVEAQCEWLRECGFRDVDCYFKIFERAVFGGRRPPSR
jgi:tRNA (cmo5U34)-methyltransferase